MSSIIDAKTAIINFFMQEFNLAREAIQVTGLTRQETGWKGMVQVTQSNPHLKELGYPPVYDKNVYTIYLDQELEVTSYWLGVSNEEED